MLTSLDLENLAKADIKLWMKLYAITSCDKLPPDLPVNSAIISNTKPSNHEGEHWIVIYRQSKRKIVCFDPVED